MMHQQMNLLKNSLVIPLIFLGGCSSKPYYSPEPTHLKDEPVHFIYQRDKQIKRIEFNRVILSTGEIYNRNGDLVKPEDKIANLLSDEVVWSKRDNLVAYITDNNSIALFDSDKNQTLFRETFSSVSTIDRRLPPPIFDKDNILYFTFNGQIAIFSISQMKIIKVVSIGKGEDYPNIIDYQLRENDLTVITHRGITVLGDNFDEHIDLDLRGAIFEPNSIFLITKDGDVRRYDRKLMLIKNIKFPFAYFIAWGEVKDTIYLIESQGYIIKLNKDLTDYQVTPSELDDENCFFTPQRFICDEKFFRL